MRAPCCSGLGLSHPSCSVNEIDALGEQAKDPSSQRNLTGNGPAVNRQSPNTPGEIVIFMVGGLAAADRCGPQQQGDRRGAALDGR
jgi:hypothetical protein